LNNFLENVVNTLNAGTLPDWIAEHVRAYEKSGGQEGHLWDSTAVGGTGLVPCLLLRTVGRKSRKSYTHPLLYGVDGANYVIVASKGGADTQPQWYFNLLAEPKILIQVKAENFPVRATLAANSMRDCGSS
jgi:deazaflavin-dependent oxidoreductase (nitroreductase family)